MSTSIRIRIEENEHGSEQRGEQQHSWAPMAQQAYCREGQNVFRERSQPQGPSPYLPNMQLFDGAGEQQRGFAPPPQENQYAPQRANCAPSGEGGGQNVQREINDIGKILKNVMSAINSFEHNQNGSANPATGGDQQAAPAQSASNGGEEQTAQAPSRGGDQQVAATQPAASAGGDQPAAVSALPAGGDQPQSAALASAPDQPSAAVADNSPAPASAAASDDSEWN